MLYVVLGGMVEAAWHNRFLDSLFLSYFLRQRASERDLSGLFSSLYFELFLGFVCASVLSFWRFDDTLLVGRYPLQIYRCTITVWTIVGFP